MRLTGLTSATTAGGAPPAASPPLSPAAPPPLAAPPRAPQATLQLNGAKRRKLPAPGEQVRARLPALVRAVVLGTSRRVRQCTALIMSNMGRYMATTMPPITTPITTIMIGSRIEVSAVTAASTSSS